MNTIAIRTDASSSIGTGHVSRCLTLARHLSRLGYHIHFIMRDLPGAMIEAVSAQGFTSHVIRSSTSDRFLDWQQDAQECIQIFSGLKSLPHWLIVDHYEIDNEWETLVKPYIEKIMFIDDLANRSHICQILLDQNLYSEMQTRYLHLIPANTIQLLGPKYALLRDEFLAFQLQPRTYKNDIHNVMIYYGGSDPTGETIKAINALSDEEYKHINFIVIVGNSCAEQEIIQQMCVSLPNFHFHCQVSNMAKLMATTDLAIGACGSSTWERCYLAVPTLSTEIAYNQTELSQVLHEKGVIYNLGWHSNVTSDTIREAFNQLSRSYSTLTNMSHRSHDLIHKGGYLGASYVATLLTAGVHTDEQANLN